MSATLLQVKTQLEIGKPIQRVFEAIVDPHEMSQYFISSGSDPMRAGNTLRWRFEEGGGLEVRVKDADPNGLVSFFWSASGTEAFVRMELVPVGSGSTLLKISESEWPADDKGIAQCIEQTRGWTHFLCCMKAYLEHGINLRKSL